MTQASSREVIREIERNRLSPAAQEMAREAYQAAIVTLGGRDG